MAQNRLRSPLRHYLTRTCPATATGVTARPTSAWARYDRRCDPAGRDGTVERVAVRADDLVRAERVLQTPGEFLRVRSDLGYRAAEVTHRRGNCSGVNLCRGPIEQHLEQHHVIGGKTPCRSRRSAALQRQWGRSALVPTSNTSAPPYRSIRAALMVSLVRVDSSSGLFQAGGRSRPHRGCSIGVLTSDQRSRPGVSGAGTPGRVA